MGASGASGRRHPPTQAATRSSGRTVADSATRWNSPARGTSRSTAVMRWTPRLDPATAWISSRITVARPPRMPRPRREVSRMLRLSGVVMRISGGCRTMRSRSSRGVSPQRVSTRTSGAGAPAAANTSRSSSSGAVRLRRTSVFSAFSGETYTTRTRPPSQAPVSSRSSAHRNAASVLPLPVGALARTCSPAAMRGHTRRWASVGSPRRPANQRRISGWKSSSGPGSSAMTATLGSGPAGVKSTVGPAGPPGGARATLCTNPTHRPGPGATDVVSAVPAVSSRRLR